VFSNRLFRETANYFAVLGFTFRVNNTTRFRVIQIYFNLRRPFAVNTALRIDNRGTYTRRGLAISDSHVFAVSKAITSKTSRVSLLPSIYCSRFLKLTLPLPLYTHWLHNDTDVCKWNINFCSNRGKLCKQNEQNI